MRRARYRVSAHLYPILGPSKTALLSWTNCPLRKSAFAKVEEATDCAPFTTMMTAASRASCPVPGSTTATSPGRATLWANLWANSHLTLIFMATNPEALLLATTVPRRAVRPRKPPARAKSIAAPSSTPCDCTICKVDTQRARSPGRPARRGGADIHGLAHFPFMGPAKDCEDQQNDAARAKLGTARNDGHARYTR